MKAIQVKYLPATNTKGTRLKATANGVKPITVPITVPRDYALNVDEQAEQLATDYCVVHVWSYKKLHGGQLPNGNYCYVMEV